MNIVHIVLGKANPERMNGVNRVVFEMATHQAHLGHNVQVFGISSSLEENFAPRKFKTKLFLKPKWIFSIHQDMVLALNQLDNNAIVHLHAGFIAQFVAVIAVLHKRKIPFVLTPHGNYMNGALYKNRIFKLLYFYLIERYLIRKAKFIHCLGDGEKADLLKLDGKVNIKVVPNGQNATLTNFDSEENPQSLVFGFCGRFTRYQKGLDILLEAFEIYKRRFEGTGILCLIGDGDYRKKFENYVVKKKLEDDILIKGSLFGEEKFKVMSQMTYFLHPSRNEGMPMAVLEAAVMGIPPIISEYTNMGSYVREFEAGYVISPNNAELLAKTMLDAEIAYQCGKLGPMQLNTRRMVSTCFNWVAINEKLVKLYQS